jgi:flagellar assembly protein FliH
MSSPALQIRVEDALREVRVVQLSLSELETRWKQREEEAFERGRQAGERALREQLVQQRADLQEFQNGLLLQLRNTLPQVARESEQGLVAIALEVARRLVAAIEISPAMVEAAIRDALAQMEETGQVTVMLHPEDLALLERVNSPLHHEQVGGEKIRFQPALHVTRGGCLIQSDFGSLDATREMKFELLKRAIES